MADQERAVFWRLLVASWAIVGVVAALLLTIIATAARILANADRAVNTANEIVATTQPIWQLEQTNAAAGQLLDATQDIERHASRLADTLQGAHFAE